MPLSIKVNLRVTGHCNQGGRKYMEDMFSVAYQQTSDDKDLEYAFFGIFDGHGGGEAATFAKEHLMDIIVKQKNFWSDKDEDVLRAIRDGYVNTHYAMWRELDKWPRTASGLPSTAGTTASIAFIRKGKIYIGHVGDSGIILGYQEDGDPQWKAKPLTKDHKPESGAEMSRIQESGGKVVSKSGVPRVVWNRPRIGHKGPVRRSTHIDEIPFLAVARSLGDLWSYNSELDRFVVSPEPDVKVVTVDVKSYRCLIFGTDGLWNMLTPQAAVSIVQAAERHNEKHFIASQQTGNGTNQQMWINPSKSLVDRALEKWSSTRLRADNTSVVTLMLDPPGPSRGEVLKNRTKETAVQSPQCVPLSMISPSSCPATFSSRPNPITSEVEEPSSQIAQPKAPVAASNVVNPDHDYSVEKLPEVVEGKNVADEKMKTTTDVGTNLIEKLDATATTSAHQQENIQDPEISSSDLIGCEIDSGNKKEMDKVITEKSGDLIVSEKPDSPSKNPDSIPLLETLVDRLSPIFTPQPLSRTETTTEASDECFKMVRQNGFLNLFDAFPSMLPTVDTNSDKSPEPGKSQTVNSQAVKVSKSSIPSRTELRSAKRRSQTTDLQSQVMPATSSSSTQEQDKSTLPIESRLKISVKDNQQPETTTTKTNDLTGSKRQHSSIQDESDNQVPQQDEPLTKRRTRSEDQRCPSDENNPVKKQKLRWPNSAKKLLSSSQKTRKTTTPSTSCTFTNNNNIVVKDMNNKEKIQSPSFQRRSLEKKATPVKSIRRPSLNGNNRVQLRGNFTLRDWDQSKSSRRSCPERSRHTNTAGNRLSIDQQLLTTPQRWLRSDTIAATPIKTLRSRNVDIAGHTVPPQVAHQYGIVKQNRIASLSGKIKLSGTSKLKTALTTTPTSQVIAGKLKSNNVAGLNGTSSSSIVGTPVMVRRVKSTRSLGTRSRLKRLGK